VRRLIVVGLIALVLVVLLVPWGLYQWGLSNIDGRPVPPHGTVLSVEDDALLRRHLHAHSSISIEPLSPWRYVAALIMSGREQSLLGSGADAAWLIARNYNSSHLKDRHTIYWHLSGAALTIWITRHWTADQILAGAADLARRSSQHARTAGPRTTGEPP
jgi:hypothetical protein